MLIILMAVYCILDCVMRDAPMVTRMTGSFEIENISLSILNNFLTAIYFITVLVLNIYCNYSYSFLMWITAL